MHSHQHQTIKLFEDEVDFLDEVMEGATDFGLWRKAERRYKDAWVILRQQDPTNVRVMGGEPWLRRDWGYQGTKSARQIPIPLPDWDLDEDDDPDKTDPGHGFSFNPIVSRPARLNPPPPPEEPSEADRMMDFFFGSGKIKKK